MSTGKELPVGDPIDDDFYTWWKGFVKNTAVVVPAPGGSKNGFTVVVGGLVSIVATPSSLPGKDLVFILLYNLQVPGNFPGGVLPLGYEKDTIAQKLEHKVMAGNSVVTGSITVYTKGSEDVWVTVTGLTVPFISEPLTLDQFVLKLT